MTESEATDAGAFAADVSARLRGPEFEDWRVPDLDRFIRAFRPRFRAMSADGRRALALALYRIGGIKEEHVANCVLRDRVDELGAEHVEYLDTLAGLLSEWGTTDEFCIVLMQPYLRNHPEQALDLVRRWNRSTHIWKRRASVVTFTRKIGGSGQFTPEVLQLCEPLLFDQDDLVRKGVGWALKDNLRGDHATVLAYIKNLRRRGVSSVITLYAIRDLRGAEREAVLRIRRSC